MGAPVQIKGLVDTFQEKTSLQRQIGNTDK